MLDNHALGNRIKTYRKKRGLSQSMLSELIDKSPTYLSFLENGNKCMSLDTFVDLANALDVSADDLLIDSLTRIRIVINKACTEILADCEAYEQKILLELLASAKDALREHKDYILWSK